MRQSADRARGKGWRWALNLGLPLLSLILYLAAAWLRSGGPGYPIDDAWIHQSYARSLAERGEMSFHPGEPSAGSTSPLWSLLLAPGHLIGQPLAWSYALGLFSMIVCAWFAGWLSAWLFPGQRWLPPLATAATVLEWHMSWAAASGMETTLFIAGTLALIALYLAGRQRRGSKWAASCGLLGGLLCLVRPEGALLVAITGLDLLLARRVRPALMLGVTWLASVAPGLYLNWQATGSLLPDTLAAKVVYVTGLGLTGRLIFVLGLVLAFWAGSLLLLLPAAAWRAGSALRQRPGRHWLPLTWSAALVLLYTLQLPVLYHHDRYLMPIIPWIIIYGLAGLLSVRPPGYRRFLLGLNGLVLLVFWIQGANIYSWNVDNIQDQQVRIALWLACSTPPQAIVAAQELALSATLAGVA